MSFPAFITQIFSLNSVFCMGFWVINCCEIYKVCDKSTTEDHKTSTSSKYFKRAPKNPVFHDMSTLKCWFSNQASLSPVTVNKCEKLFVYILNWERVQTKSESDSSDFCKSHFQTQSAFAGCSEGKKAPAGFV